MNRIPINKLRLLYEDLEKKRKNKAVPSYILFNYLHLSVHYSRDEREFDENNYKLLDSLLSNNSSLKNHKYKKTKVDAYINYLTSFKEYKYILSKELPLTLVIDTFRYLKQLIDSTGLALIIFFSILLNRSDKKKIARENLKNSRVYSIYYWNSKGSKSASYYFPGILENKDNRAFISSFASTRSYSYSLYLSLNHSEYLSPVNCLDIKGLFLSIFQTFHLYIHDLYLALSSKDYSLLRYWVGWKKTTEIFYSILVYNTLIKLAKNSENCEYISWYENQVTSRAFSLAISYLKRSKKTNSALSSYNGTPFTINSKKQYLPSKLEKEIGFWGAKYYVQDTDSLNEMHSYLKRNNISITLEVIPKSMLRLNNSNSDSRVKLNFRRSFTIFTHDSYWDLIACILSLLTHLEDNYFKVKKLSAQNIVISIRLHPSLKKHIAIEKIKMFQEIPGFIKYEFIDNREESILDSMKSSDYCVFGVSSYINLALKFNYSVIGVETNHIYSPPIKLGFINSPKLTILYPW